MAAGAFKIVGQDGSIAPSLPVLVGVSALQAALAAGAESTFAVNTSRPGFFDGLNDDWALFATVVMVPAGNEANVQYVVQVNSNFGPTGTSIVAKVRNVGSALGTKQWQVAVLGIPLGVA